MIHQDISTLVRNKTGSLPPSNMYSVPPLDLSRFSEGTTQGTCASLYLYNLGVPHLFSQETVLSHTRGEQRGQGPSSLSLSLSLSLS